MNQKVAWDKSETHAHIIHEVSNSLSVLGAVSHKLALISTRENPKVEDLRELSKKLLKSLERVYEIIETFKELMRSSTVKLETTSIVQVVKEAQEVLSADFDTLRVNLQIEVGDPSPLVLTSKTSLVSILVNLLKNACIAANKSDSRVVKVVIMTKDDKLLLSIIDGGDGIPPAHVDHLFKKPFTTNPERGGLGVGLIIVSRLTAAIGGRVFLKSKSMPTEFVLELPLSG